MKTYYALLGISSAATTEDIVAAYQQQRERYSAARVAELDADIQQVAAERSAELDAAFQTLSDPQRRREYDERIGVATPDESAATANMAPARSRQEWRYALAGVVIGLVIIGLIWAFTDRNDMPSVGEMNRPAPDFTLPGADGQDVRMADYRGKVVLVNFWATWCEPCRRETPALQSVYSDLQDEGLMIIGVNLTDDELLQGNTLEDIRAFVDTYNVTYPVALDMEGDVTQAYRVYPLPTSYFVDQTGTIRYVRVGEITAEEVAALFAELQQTAAADEQPIPRR